MGFKTHYIDTEGVPLEIVKAFAGKHRFNAFIETGTAGGESIGKIYDMFWFSNIHTIELAHNTVVKQAGINYHEGNSPEVLKTILPSYKHKPVFFFLDAHYSNPTPSKIDEVECPLIKELDAISEYTKDVLIVIDDARLFLGPPPSPLDPRKWPTVQDIFLKIRELFPANFTTIVDDYIITLNYANYCQTLHQHWLDQYDKRYPSDLQRLKRSAKECLVAIKRFIE